MPTIYRSIPVWLRVGLGCTQIIFTDRNGATAHALWDPSNNSDNFGVKIGGADSPVRGTLVGERYSRQILQECISLGLLPLSINYTVTDRDNDLMKLVAVGSLAAWDAEVVPVAKVAGVTTDPGPVAANSSPGAPGVPPGSALPPFSLPPPPSAPATPPRPLPAPPGTTTPIVLPAAPGISDTDRAELLAILERSYPGESTGILSAVDLYAHYKSGALTPIQALTAAVPILGIDNPKLIEELQRL